jgi:S-ribosylhomocysteine lyase
MKKIASFCIDHTKLLPGIYVSRVDDDIITYDIRMIRPNTPPYLANGELHTIEHLFATFARDSEYADRVIYFGPMGCRTGFYFLLRNVPRGEAVRLIIRIFRHIANYEGEIPGTAPAECGNYREHDLVGAKRRAQAFLPVIESWDETKLEYRY